MSCSYVYGIRKNSDVALSHIAEARYPRTCCGKGQAITLLDLSVSKRKALWLQYLFWHLVLEKLWDALTGAYMPYDFGESSSSPSIPSSLSGTH